MLLTGAEDASHIGAAQAAIFREDLLRWYDACRRDLPWRRTRDPWAIWVSEIMLQQTRVDTVIPYYERFLARFPTPVALAEAPEDQVLALWSGLGYYRRARLLHAGARAAATSGVPDQRDTLLAIPGIGRYTAGAIASIAFGRPVGLVDGNVARVLARLFAIEDDMKRGGMRKAEALADALVPADRPGEHNQALMELGATICTPRNPACDRCPVARSCRALAEDKVARLPVLGEKTKPKAQKLHALVARNGGKVLLARRRSDGLFGGLWEPPMVATAGALEKAFAVVDAKKVGTVTHVLSHRRLTIDVLAGKVAREPAELPDPYETAGFFEELALGDLGISTLARKVLACGS